MHFRFSDRIICARHETQTLEDDENVTFDGVSFKIIDTGPGESPANSIWQLEGEKPIYFVGDIFYHDMHAYLADGYYNEWLEALTKWESLLPDNALLYQGHGKVPSSKTQLQWQRRYIETFVQAVKTAQADAIEQQVTDKMKEFLPNDDLLFLMKLSIPSMQKRL